MNTIFLVFIGAGLGGVLRYVISNGVYLLFKPNFPLGTLIVNISGCFLMGLLFIILLERFAQIGSELRAFILIGMLGGYTTFSSFSIETINLFENGDWLRAIINIFLSLGLCFAATWIGVVIGRNI
ncbi:MAG: fluoride efflux transporter CrcB [Rickettsiella sp.]|nr:fluoride efflux transporter CrcB [Rickettsiella sp.]